MSSFYTVVRMPVDSFDIRVELGIFDLKFGHSSLNSVVAQCHPFKETKMLDINVYKSSIHLFIHSFSGIINNKQYIVVISNIGFAKQYMMQIHSKHFIIKLCIPFYSPKLISMETGCFIDMVKLFCSQTIETVQLFPLSL